MFFFSGTFSVCCLETAMCQQCAWPDFAHGRTDGRKYTSYLYVGVKWQLCQSELSMALALSCAPLGVGPKTWPSLYNSRVACTQWCGHSWGFPFIVSNDALTRMTLLFVKSISSGPDSCFSWVIRFTLIVALIRLVLQHSLRISWFVS